MRDRVIAVSDIHGCSAALAAVVAAIDLRASDTVVLLGDLIDRGIDSRGVLDQLLHLRTRCRLVAVLGNHEEMFVKARTSRAAFRFWLECGGTTTLDSYGDSGRLSLIPADHVRFLETCVPYSETDAHIFVHAGYEPALPLDRQDGHVLRWRSLHDGVPARHLSGKTAVVGHTPHAEILDAGHLICLDTGCGFDGGWLTAMDVSSGVVWQADERGRLRRPAVG
jgi:serine/threonine protein phosphatase 1